MLVIFDVEGNFNAEYLPVLSQIMGPEKRRKFGVSLNKVYEGR